MSVNLEDARRVIAEKKAAQMGQPDKIKIAKAVNATVITLEVAPAGYRDFDKGVSKKFVLNPHGLRI